MSLSLLLVAGALAALAAEGPRAAPRPGAGTQTTRSEKLSRAARKGDLDKVEKLLDEGVSSFGNALIHAAGRGDRVMVETLLDAGADVDARMKSYGWTALVRAARTKRNEEVLELLLRAGAQIDAQDRWGQSALEHAVREGRLFNFRYLLKAGAPATDRVQAFFLAAKLGDAMMLQDLMAAGVPVDVRDPRDRNRSALVYAALEGRDDAIRSLVRGGADVNETFDNGRTALHFAALKGDAEAARALIEIGARRETADFLGRTALETARLHHQDEEIVDVLSR